MRKRHPGRPRRPVITRDLIVVTALAMLERQGLAGMSMNALARELGVNPMALYHYFDDRDALLAAAGAHAFGEVFAAAPRASASWKAALLGLAERYLSLLAGAGELLRYLAAHERAAEVPTQLFADHVLHALAPLALTRSSRSTAHDVFVDFVHGFALGVPRTGLTADLRRRLRAELGILCNGIEVSSAR